jgi:hypothetical protein
MTLAEQHAKPQAWLELFLGAPDPANAPDDYRLGS